jgi:hypothetical protein
MNHRISGNLITLALILLLTACSSNVIYRSNFTETCNYRQSSDCAKNALQVHGPGEDNEYRLGFVEYDDQGQLRDRMQMQNVVDEYTRLARSEDVLLISFVHGWHHSAMPGDGNIKSFRKMLASVSAMENIGSKQQGRKKRKVIGLYIGWRGDSISVPYVNAITFWDRKNTAHEVGQQGVTELLLKLEEIVNVRRTFEEAEPPPLTSRLVVIGHSFGGAVVYASLQKILADRFIDSRPGKNYNAEAKGFGDLVVLLNPAFEALRFASLYDLSQQNCKSYSLGGQLPKLAILTSEADYATRYAFPLGRVFSTFFESHVPLDRHYCSGPGDNGIQPMTISEGKADRNTVGHFTPYLTHRLDPAPDNVVSRENFQIEDLQITWAKHSNDIPMEFIGSRLESLKRTTALNPYLNISVDKKLIKDHNDIWGDEIVAFIRDFIAIATTPVSASK